MAGRFQPEVKTRPHASPARSAPARCADAAEELLVFVRRRVAGQQVAVLGEGGVERAPVGSPSTCCTTDAIHLRWWQFRLRSRATDQALASVCVKLRSRAYNHWYENFSQLITNRATSWHSRPANGPPAGAPGPLQQRRLSQTDGAALAYNRNQGIDAYLKQVHGATPMQMVEMERSGRCGRLHPDLSKRMERIDSVFEYRPHSPRRRRASRWLAASWTTVPSLMRSA